MERFLSAQQGIYQAALAELRSGRKRSHWMWFIFPQLAGLGVSPTARKFAISSLAEAREYLAHPLLGARLLECTEAVLAVEGKSVSEIFGYPDDLKLRSSMTLFARAAGDGAGSPFQQVLDRFWRGEPDRRTLDLLGGEVGGQPA
jgi:uncharacterized protein (DUF1810 family)